MKTIQSLFALLLFPVLALADGFSPAGTTVSATGTVSGITLTATVNGSAVTLTLGGAVTGFLSTTGTAVALSGTIAETQVTSLTTDLAAKATTAGNLSQFAATTSAQFLGVISDELGTGKVVADTNTTLTTTTLTGTTTVTGLISITQPNTSNGITINGTAASYYPLDILGSDRGDGFNNKYRTLFAEGGNPGIRTNGYITINGDSGSGTGTIPTVFVPSETGGYMLGISSDVGANPAVLLKSFGPYIRGYNSSNVKTLEISPATGLQYQVTTNGTSSFQVLNSASNAVLSLDTTNPTLTIGASSPTIKAKDSNGTSAAFFGNSTNSASLSVNRNPATGVFEDSSKTHAQINLNGAATGSQIEFYVTTATNAVGGLAMILNSGSNVGIGSGATARSRLDVTGATPTSNFLPGQLTVNANDAVAADKGGFITLSGYYSGTSPADFGGISARKANATSADYGGYLSLWYRHFGTVPLVEGMRIDTNGNVGVAGTAPTSTLHDFGSFAMVVTSTNGSLTLTGSHANIIYTGTGGHTHTLPTSVGISGRIYADKNEGTGALTQNTTSSQTIFNTTTATSWTLNIGDAQITKSDGANWSGIPVRPIIRLSGTLTSGTAGLNDTRITGRSGWVQDTNTSSLTNVGTLTMSISGSTATIKSTNVVDTSTFDAFFVTAP